MHSKLTKYAAAIIITAGLLSLTFFDKAVTPAYAIEQTLEAMKTAHNGYAEWIDRKGRRVKTWAQIDNKTDKIGKMRLEYEDGGLYIMSDGKTYFEDEGIKGIGDGLYIESGLLFNNFITAIARKLPADSQMTIEKQFNQEFQREVAVVDIKRPWMEFQAVVDMDTKLPIKFSIPRTDDMTEPLDHTELIKYNIDLPEGIFDFEVGPGTLVLSKELDTQFSNDPRYGMPFGSEDDIQDVCQKLAAKYMQARIEGDIKKIMQLHPIYINRYGSSKMIENKEIQDAFHNGKIMKVLEFKPAYEHKGPNWMMVPCKIAKEQDGQQKESLVGVVVYLREHEGQQSAVVIGYFPNLQGDNAN